MRIRKVFIGIFLLTFVIGSALVFSSKKDVVSNERNIQTIEELPIQIKTEETQSEIRKSAIISYEVAKTFGGSELLDENYWEKEFKYKFELLETGEFHGDEVTAKSGQKWLGFFSKGDDFYLDSTNIDVSRVQDEIVDGNNKQKKTGRKVSVKNRTEPLFLIKNALKLNEGKVETLFKGLTLKETDETKGYSAELKSEFVYNYQIGGENYALRVEKVFNKKLEIVYALILESETNKQILHVSSDDYLGILFWVGDLDHDNKPDFYLAPWIQENNSEVSLFLSSEADKKNLVKKVASMRTSGC